jgi:hypothetical protein
MPDAREVFDALTNHAQNVMRAVREGRVREVERTTTNGITIVRSAIIEPHPDLLVRCDRCRFIALEHDPMDMACPDDDDHARINREEAA